MDQTLSNNFKVSSQLFIQQIEVAIVKLTMALAVEHSIKPDPDAKEMVRQILLSRANQLMSEESENFVKRYKEYIAAMIKNTTKVREYTPNSSYEFIKLMGLDDA